MTRLLVLLAAIAMPLVAWLTNTGTFGPDNGTMSDRYPTLLVAAGYAFAIWGLIFLLDLAYAAWQLTGQRKQDPTLSHIAPWAAAGFALTTIWMPLFAMSQFWLCLLVIFGAAFCLIRCAMILSHDHTPQEGQWMWAWLPLSLHAGWLMVLPMLFATVMTYAYMGWADIGISVNTVPVIAVGVGVGIDYAVYFMDRIREEMAVTRNIHRAVVNAVATTGYAVSFTAATLIAGVVMWIFMSDLRFQSDAAVLLSFMLVVNALAAMLIVPAWCVVFRPHFVVATHYDEDGVLEEDDAPRDVARAAA